MKQIIFHGMLFQKTSHDTTISFSLPPSHILLRSYSCALAHSLLTIYFGFGTLYMMLKDLWGSNAISKLFVLRTQEGERVVMRKEGVDFAREYGCLFIECSAKTRTNVQQCFEELVLKVWITITLFNCYLFLFLFRVCICVGCFMSPFSLCAGITYFSKEKYLVLLDNFFSFFMVGL